MKCNPNLNLIDVLYEYFGKENRAMRRLCGYGKGSSECWPWQHIFKVIGIGEIDSSLNN